MSLAATKIQNVRVKNPDFDKNEHRLSEYGALDFFLYESERNPLLTEEMKRKAFDASGKTLQIPVINYDGSVSISNTRSCAIQDAENTSALVTMSFTTYAAGFTMVPAMYSNNEIDYENDFAKKLKRTARLFGAALDTAAVAVLESNKTQVFGDTLLYSESSDTIVVPWASREDILGDIEPMMAANDFYGSIHVVGNVGVRSILGKLAEKSVYNEVNKDLEWENKKFHFTNRLTGGDNDYAVFYAIEEGNVDILYRYDREAARGAASVTGHEWDVVNMPYINIPVGLHYYEAVGDQSGIAGDATADLTCGIKEYYGFSVDVAFVVAYNSALTTKANPIMKCKVTKGDTYAQPVFIANTEDNPVPTSVVE